MTLKADAHHLLTDVWTSAGVMLGVGLMFLAKLAKLDWWWLDPIIGLAVGVNIIWAGWKLMQESFAGLMDASMSKEDNEALAECLAAHVIPGQINFHGLRTRIAGRERFAQAHLLVPGYWSVQKAHDLCEIIENDVFTRFDELEIMFHLEPIEDELSYADVPITSIPVHEEGHLPPSATAYNQ